MSPSGMIRGREGNGTKFLKGTLVTAPSRYPTRDRVTPFSPGKGLLPCAFGIPDY